jgi:hypothetical protein
MPPGAGIALHQPAAARLSASVLAEGKEGLLVRGFCLAAGVTGTEEAAEVIERLANFGHQMRSIQCSFQAAEREAGPMAGSLQGLSYC